MTPSDGEVDHKPEGRRRPLGWRGAARVLIAVVLLGAVVAVLASQWQDVRPLLRRLSGLSVAGASAAVLAGIFTTFLAWRALIADLGFPLPWGGAMRVFFIGQLGKYLPGSVWPIVAQMELGRDYRVPPRASGTAVVVFLVVIVGSGLVVAVPLLPLLGNAALAQYWWTVLVLPAAVLAATPAVLNRLIALALRLSGRQPMPRPLSARGIIRAAGWSLLAWVVYGAHVWILAQQLGAQPGFRLLLVSIGGFAAGWLIGFFFVVAPAGAGAREAALILLLTGALSTPQATVIALVSRLLFTVGDLVWCLPAFVLQRRRRVSGLSGAGAPQ